MQCTQRQAEIIGIKLYIQPVNKKHCEDWVLKNVSKAQATKILNEVMQLNYNLSKDDPEKYERVQEWGRAELKRLGYTERAFNPSL